MNRDSLCHFVSPPPDTETLWISADGAVWKSEFTHKHRKHSDLYATVKKDQRFVILNKFSF